MIYRVNNSCDAAEICRIIEKIPDDSVLVFEPGEYFLDSAIEVNGKQGLILDGRGAMLRPHFDRSAFCGECTSDFIKSPTPDSEVMHICGCKRLTIRGFEIRSDNPSSCSGRIISVGDGYVDVRVDSSIPLTGSELFIAGLTVKEDGQPTNGWWVNAEFEPERRTLVADEIPCTAPMRLPAKTEYLGGQDFRVRSAKQCMALKVGSRVTVQHSYYGLSAFVFRNSSDVLIEDVTLSDFGGFGFTILPRCENFDFRRIKIATNDREKKPVSINSDGIHSTGLSGRLSISDSYFEFPGDDCLNVHTQALLVTNVDGNSATVVFDKVCGNISPDWGRPGDILRVFDRETLERREIRLESAAPSKVVNGFITELRVKVAGEPPKVGDYIANAAYYPEVVIRNTEVVRPRGRSFCLQSCDRLEISGCTFEDFSSSLYMSGAPEHWGEAGGLSDVDIHSNIFRRGKLKEPWAAVYVRVNTEKTGIKHFHRNITIRENHFEDVSGKLFRINSTDGVEISSNTFVRCKDCLPELNNCT